ncbi:PleD family two-component system response regulator [Caulobacter sp. S45]|jgi:two-component system chemotaxis response regulator CheY|uniref:response regulator n=1 Tax=Caulobacter sp. S45 TaxID=1641861 RepID=UPI00131B7496|nr:response regulator [Caulobacter sp. S45]
MKMCLVVDDSRVVRKVARRILEALDFETAEASDGAEALAFCRTAMPDAILVDWRMPNMDGLEFVRTLRQEPEGGRPIVVFCAAENEPARIAEALDQGADEFIMKPFDGDIVAHKFGLAGLL